MLNNIKIIKIISSLRIREIKINKYEIDKYIIMKIYFSKINPRENKVFIYLRRKIYIVDDLRIKMLINNDIIDLESIVINIVNKTTYINNCKIIIKISTRSHNEFIKKKIYIQSTILISPYNNVFFSIKFINFFNDRDFLFELFTQINLTLFIYLIDYFMINVFVKNNINFSI